VPTPLRSPLLLILVLVLFTLVACSSDEQPTAQPPGGGGGAGGSGAGTNSGGGGAGGAGGSQPTDGDGDGYLAPDDCDDTDADVHPGATEVCDGADNDCDGTIDGPEADGQTVWYWDEDGDDWGLADPTVVACDQPDGYAPQPGDCDDGAATVHPGAPEICDLLDNNCDGVIDVSDAPLVNPWGDYYDTVDVTSGASMRLTGHQAIDDHQQIPYSSGGTDTWVVLELADEAPNDPNNILDVYRNAIYPKQGGGNPDYDREHAWPQSYLPDNSSTYPQSDCHHLFLVDSSYNSSRGNLPYDTCDGSCTERPTELNNTQGGGTGSYPGNSNWRRDGTWETWISRRGDVARALLYLDVRYEGGTHSITGHTEPDLILTDDRNLIVASSASDTTSYMGVLSTLVRWHCEDPVSAEEVARHQVVVSYQGNRNLFIDHPEWVYCVFFNLCAN